MITPFMTTTHSILQFPHPHLRHQARKIEQFDEKLQQLIATMFTIMRDHAGIGLAATQIDIPLQLSVIDIPGEPQTPLVMVNPRIEVMDNERIPTEEGCLSIADFRARIARPKAILLHAQDGAGKNYQLSSQGLLAVCIQHEYDHLYGRLFIDYLPPLRREIVRRRLSRRARQQKAHYGSIQ